MNYSTLIFDLDGTLTDPALGIVRCMNFALTSCGYLARPEHEITPFIGPPLEAALESLSGQTDQAEIKQLIAAYRKRYVEMGFKENSVYPGIRELLYELNAQGKRMGVCTSKLETSAVKILNEFELIKYFDFVSGVSGEKFKERKADQLAGLYDSNRIASDSLMIGDRAIDIEAAAENNLKACGVLWGYGQREELENANPTAIIAQPSDLLAILA